MTKEKPLWQRMYGEPLYAEIVRVVGYAGLPYREFQPKLEALAERFGTRAVEQAGWRLVTYDGQFTGKPPPLATVTLRAEVRKYAVGLLGPPPEHPWYGAVKNNEAIPFGWEEEEGKPKEPDEPQPEPKPAKKKRARKK
jgi:hypothetical protein